MSKFEIDKKISQISTLISNMVIHNVESAYRDFNDEKQDAIGESDIDKFHLSQRKKHKETVEKWIIRSEIDKKLEEYILLENDPYGLDTKETNLINSINDCFFELEREMLIDTTEIREAWKSRIFGEYFEEIKRLKKSLEEYEIEKSNIQNKLGVCQENLKIWKNNWKVSQENLKESQDKLEICQENLKISQHNLKVCQDKLKVYEENLRVYKHKLREYKEELEIYKKKEEELNYELQECKREKVSIERKLEELKENGIRSEKTQKEISYYLKLLERAKEMRNENESIILENKKVISQKEDIIRKLNDNLVDRNNELKNKDKIIRDLKNQLKEKQELEEKKALKEMIKIKGVDEFRNIYRELFEDIKVILMELASNHKKIEGELMQGKYMEISRMNFDIRGIRSLSESVTLIDKLIVDLSNINKKCIANGIDYDIEKILNKLVELKEKI